MIVSRHVLAIVALGVSFAGALVTAAPVDEKKAVESALERAGKNRAQLERALEEVAPARRGGLEFLLANMPEVDLTSLETGFLLENVNLAYDAIERAPWGKSIPTDIFLNDVLPYANVNETRERWRKDFAERFWPLVKDCKTAGEAAQVLNRKIFPLLKVRFSTKRRKADQSPSESIEIGMASCTGLSIILADASRAVGVPARLVGIPNWANKRGNHTWVEIWDQRWHFTGAAEPSNKGLDHAWFQHDASLADASSPIHSIYAASYRKTDTVFPMVWANRIDWVHAVNVTHHYTKKKNDAATKEVFKTRRLLIDVFDRRGGERVVAKIDVLRSNDGKLWSSGMTKDGRADPNDILVLEVPPARSLRLRVKTNSLGAIINLKLDGSATEETVRLYVDQLTARSSPTALTESQGAEVRQAVTAYFDAAAKGESRPSLPKHLDALVGSREGEVRDLVWSSYRNSKLHPSLAANLEKNEVRFGSQVSPYVEKTVGKKPSSGWPLFIAMHGGGGVPKRVNDSQWKIMQRYYRDHPEVGGYRYLALRAPNDRWNGFYDDQISALVEELVRQFVIFRDVDPNKVFIMGYSHGGYGAFAIGPKIPQRFAAIHSSAAAPTGGHTSAKTLRNTVFTFMIGERDTAYGRIERCRKFDETIQKLRQENAGAYPVTMEYRAGFGHGGLPDRDKIRDMYKHVRQPVPSTLTWEMTDSVIDQFFWLSVEKPSRGKEVHASVKDQRLSVTMNGVDRVIVGLDSRLVDLSKELSVEISGKTTKVRLAPSLDVLCRSLWRSGDIHLAYTVEVSVTKPTEAAEKIEKTSRRRI
jgi:dienelactone hydrolase